MPRPQLKMSWPGKRLNQPPAVDLAEGYAIRQCTPADEPSFVQLMHDCGWNDWGDELLAFCKSRLLPSGWFLAIHSQSDAPVASAMSLHNYTCQSPYSGTLGWIGCAPEHRGKRLGAAVSAAATERMLRAGYRDIELYTEHFRLPALRSYLNLGYVPYLYDGAVTEVWREVCSQLGWPFTPSVWPTGDNAFPSH